MIPDPTDTPVRLLIGLDNWVPAPAHRAWVVCGGSLDVMSVAVGGCGRVTDWPGARPPLWPRPLSRPVLRVLGLFHVLGLKLAHRLGCSKSSRAHTRADPRLRSVQGLSG
ncbi:hypothetical protein GCM10010532_057860 [Dactylosporangium siamense]|uniref:Uncharacterized protein n=1 Tax=Dactylosporangium siamense TaxID=685454 RepID=A0A919UC22_9ACTN|nr:hypothetical protein Dsi01nite_043120 [Dactylosporangium siamense]